MTITPAASQNLSAAAWRKSTYSGGGSDQECIEVPTASPA